MASRYNTRLRSRTLEASSESLLRPRVDDEDESREVEKQEERSGAPLRGWSSLRSAVRARPTQNGDWGGITPVTEERLRLAAAYVEDARTGRFEHGEAAGLQRGTWNHRAFRVYYHPAWIQMVYLSYCVHLLLLFFEPATSFRNDRPRCSGRSLLSLIELLCALVYVFDTWLKIQHMGWREFRKKKWNVATLVIRGTIVADVVGVILLGFSARVSRIIRPLLVLTRSRDLRLLLNTIARTLPKLLEVGALLLCSIVVYALIGVLLFADTHDGSSDQDFHESFHSFPHALITLFVLLTVDNFPNIMIPSFRRSTLYSLYFILYLLGALYLLMPLILTIVADVYKAEQKATVSKERVKERRGLVEAFRLLSEDKSQGISYETWLRLIQILQPDKDDRTIRFLFDTIDTDGSGRVDLLEFLELCDCLLLDFRMEDASDPMSPTSRHHDLGRRMLRGLFLLVEVVDGVCLCLDRHPYRTGIRNPYRILLAVWCAFEVVIRIYSARRLKYFWTRGWNCFEVIVAVCAVVGEGQLFPFDIVNRLMVAIAFLRMFRIMRRFGRLRSLAESVFYVTPALARYGVLLMVEYYMFAVLGMELLAGRLPSDTSECTNFDDAESAFLTLFSLMSGSSWSDTMHTAVRGVGWPLVGYFLGFYIGVIAVSLNLLIAIMLDAFQIQLQLRAAVEVVVEVPGEEDDSETMLLHVSKSKLRWDRELMRTQLDEMHKKELQELSRYAGVDLVEMKRRKNADLTAQAEERERRKAHALHMLHGAMYGTMVAAKLVRRTARRSHSTLPAE